MKKAVSVLCILVLAGILAACGRNGDTQAPTPRPDVGDRVQEVGDALVLPLVDEPITFTIWTQVGSLMDAGLENLHDSYFYRELERRTGVSIRFIQPPVGGELEGLNLLLAAGDLPDVLELNVPMVSLPGGLSRGIEDGIIIDVTDLTHDYAPYYWQSIHVDEWTRLHSFTDDGHLPGFWQFRVQQPPWFGLTSRQDWLDDLGLDTPITYDDWHHALSLFRDEKGATAPMMLPGSGFMAMEVFHAGFGISPSFFQVDGEIRFGPLEPGFKEYVTMMHQWFNDGLIDPDFAARLFWIGPQDFTTTGLTGLWPDVYVLFPVNNMVSPDPNFRSIAVPPPVRYVGQTVHFATNNLPTQFIWTVTSNNHDPATFTRWMNYVYSPEGSMLVNWGIEGDTFIFGDDGRPQFTAKMYDNPNFPLNNVIQRYTMPFNNGGHNSLWYRELTPGTHPDVMGALDIWGTNVDFAYMLPLITLNPDEGMEFAQIMTDINSHRDEMVARFIIGAEPLENFDAFINTIRNMNIDRAIEIQQAALDRFYAR